MPATNMIACPHCGTENSRQKQVCYHCQQKLAKATSQKIPAKQRAKSPAGSIKNTISGRISAVIFGASLRDRAQAYRQLYSLLHSGIPAGLALHHVSTNCPLGLRPIFSRLAKHAEKGGLLTEGMKAYGGLFPAWEVSVVAAAERSGTLPNAMRDIADALETEWDLRARTNAATWHLKMTGWVAVLVVLIISGLQGKGTVANRVENSFVFFGLIVAAYMLALILWTVFRRTAAGSRLTSLLAPRIPIIGPVMQNMTRVRFARIMGTLWHAGVSPREALEVAARTTDDRYFMRRVAEVSRGFDEGMLLSEVLAQTKFLPQQAIYLIQTGESSGTIVDAMEKIAEYYQIELDAQVKTLPMKLQLLFYAIIVPIVAYIVIGFYSGIFRTYNDLLK